MSRYAFLRTRRWVGFMVLAVVVATACVFLGRWQFHRYEYKAEQADLVTSNYQAAPAPAGELLTSATAFEPRSEWRTVELVGEYVGTSVVLPQRGVPGTAGDHVLATLRTEIDGVPWLVVVDRGWYPGGASTDNTAFVPLPTGEVTLTARLRPAEPNNSRGARPGAVGEVFAINPAQVREAAGAPDDGATLLDGAYLRAATESPAGGPLQAFPKPDTDLGNHLSYALQWWTFSLGALVSVVVMARREARERDEAAGIAPNPQEAERRRARRKDGDVEDELIDEQLAG